MNAGAAGGGGVEHGAPGRRGREAALSDGDPSASRRPGFRVVFAGGASARGGEFIRRLLLLEGGGWLAAHGEARPREVLLACCACVALALSVCGVCCRRVTCGSVGMWYALRSHGGFLRFPMN